MSRRHCERTFAILRPMDDTTLIALRSRLEIARRSAACMPRGVRVSLASQDLVDLIAAVQFLLGPQRE